jgi:hypothetical protein
MQGHPLLLEKAHAYIRILLEDGKQKKHDKQTHMTGYLRGRYISEKLNSIWGGDMQAIPVNRRRDPAC